MLLLDELLSHLDLKLRQDMRLEISGLQRQLGTTTILVTHDQGETLVMSDRVDLTPHRLGRSLESVVSGKRTMTDTVLSADIIALSLPPRRVTA